MAQLLGRAGFSGVDDPAGADLLIVNTCGFIAPARDESREALQELASAKRPDQLLIAAGCWAQLAGTALMNEVPGLDGILGTRRWMDLVSLVEKLRRGAPSPQIHLPEEALAVGTDERGVLRAVVQGPSAYLKIADGCRRPCAFCSIPQIKGTAVSRPVERILREATQLTAMGVKELVLIAQDTSDYGHDRRERDGLATLLDHLVRTVPDLPWIRILYAYPGYVTPRLIEAMARHPQVLHYLDIPLQHAHTDVLKRMRRPANVDAMRTTIRELRRAMPDIALRTTFIVGYPGETEDEFGALLDFVLEMQFDRLGTFSFWPEEGTPAAQLPYQVPDEVKEERHRRLMMTQQEISLHRNQAQVGRTLDVLFEGARNGSSVGRSYRDAPEIDGQVIVNQQVSSGEIVPIRITGATIYDVTGIPQQVGGHSSGRPSTG